MPAAASATVAAGQAFLGALAADRDAIIQRWMPSVETHGERSLVWVDGEFTHAIRKPPRFAGGVEQVTEVAIADDERAFAIRALAPSLPNSSTRASTWCAMARAYCA